MALPARVIVAVMVALSVAVLACSCALAATVAASAIVDPSTSTTTVSIENTSSAGDPDGNISDLEVILPGGASSALDVTASPSEPGSGCEGASGNGAGNGGDNEVDCTGLSFGPGQTLAISFTDTQPPAAGQVIQVQSYTTTNENDDPAFATLTSTDPTAPTPVAPHAGPSETTEPETTLGGSAPSSAPSACPTSGALPPGCRWDDQPVIVTPGSGGPTRSVTFRVTVTNRGPATSPAAGRAAADDLTVSAPILELDALAHGAIVHHTAGPLAFTTLPSGCRPRPGHPHAVACTVPALKDGGRRTVSFTARLTPREATALARARADRSTLATARLVLAASVSGPGGEHHTAHAQLALG